MRALLLPVAAALWLAGCPHPPPASRRPVEHGGKAQSFATPRALLERVRAVNDGYGTMEAIHRVTVEIALGGERTEQRSFRAALAVRRPGLFRLQILGPMGVKAVDLLYNRGHHKVLHMSGALEASSRIPAIIDSIAEDIRTIFRLDPQPRVHRWRMEESVALASRSAPLYVLEGRRGEELVRQLNVYATTLAVARAEVLDQQGGIRTVSYGDYQTDGERLVPRQIHLAKEGDTFYWLAIRVESVKLDEELDDAMFVPGGE